MGTNAQPLGDRKVRRRWIVWTAWITLALAGCAPTQWTRPGLTPEQWARDSYECERDVRQSGWYGRPGLGGLNQMGAMQRFWGRCMEARGYSRVTD